MSNEGVYMMYSICDSFNGTNTNEIFIKLERYIKILQTSKCISTYYTNLIAYIWLASGRCTIYGNAIQYCYKPKLWRSIDIKCKIDISRFEIIKFYTKCIYKNHGTKLKNVNAYNDLLRYVNTICVTPNKGFVDEPAIDSFFESLSYKYFQSKCVYETFTCTLCNKLVSKHKKKIKSKCVFGTCDILYNAYQKIKQELHVV